MSARGDREDPERRAQAGGSLFLRPHDRPDARPIAGSDDARVPFVSPDGQWVGFSSANEIRKAPIEGGAATTVAVTTPMRQGLWIADWKRDAWNVCSNWAASLSKGR